MGKNNIVFNLKGLTFSYPGKDNIFKNLNFTLKKGDKIGLIGDNGSGKTTLLHTIMGILKPTEGQIYVFDKVIINQQDFLFVRQCIGLLFQNSDDQLFFPTVLEDVAFGPLNLGKKPKEARKIAMQTLADLNLNGFENRITYQLSGGEKKLVALATILAMQPQVLLLDEPTSGLDPATKIRLSEILGKLDISYIIVSHEYDFLIENTNKIYSLKDGVITYHSESSTLHSHFHSHPAGEVHHEHKQQ